MIDQIESIKHEAVLLLSELEDITGKEADLDANKKKDGSIEVIIWYHCIHRRRKWGHSLTDYDLVGTDEEKYLKTVKKALQNCIEQLKDPSDIDPREILD